MAEALRNKTVNGMMWKLLEKGLLQGFGFVQGIILARLLSPGDYGLIAMVSVFTGVAGIFVSSGLGLALIHKQDKTDIDYSTVFDCNFGIGFVSLVVLCSCSGLIAKFYNEPILVQIVCLEALSMFLSSSFGIQSAKLISSLRFREDSIISIATTVASGIAGIVMAFAGFGVMSLIYPNFIRIFVTAVLYWYFQHWFPGIRFSIKSFKELFGYGSRILGSGIINVIFGNFNSLIIGKVYSKEDLGYYNRGNQYADLVSGTFLNMLGVANPVLNKIQNDNERLREVYRRMVREACFVIFPLLVGLTVLAHPIIILMITSKWEPSVLYLQLFCIGALGQPIQSLNNNFMLAKGQVKIMMRLNFITKAFLLVATFCVLPFGVIWICVVVVCYNLLIVPLYSHYISRALGMSVWEQALDCAPALTLSLLMGGVVWGATSFISSDAVKLIVGVPLGGIVYLGVAKAFHSKDLDYLVAIIKDNIVPKLRLNK